MTGECLLVAFSPDGATGNVDDELFHDPFQIASFNVYT